MSIWNFPEMCERALRTVVGRRSSIFISHRALHKRSIWDQCKKYEYWQPTDDRPTSGPIHTFCRISNGHNSATRHPINFVFVSRVAFSEMADRTAPFPVGSNPRWRPAAILKNIKWPNLLNPLSDSLYVWTLNTDRQIGPQTVDAYDRRLDIYFTMEGINSRHTVYRERTERQIWRKGRENNARGVYIRLVTHNLMYFLYFLQEILYIQYIHSSFTTLVT